MITLEQVPSLHGTKVYDRNGEKIGSVGQVYLDDDTGQPEWITVNTGLFGMKENFAPVAAAQAVEGGVAVPYSKDTVKDAPKVDKDADGMAPEEEQELYRYYGMPASSQPTDRETAREEALPEEGAAEEGVRAEGEPELTRSEERMRVGTARMAAGKARLHKYVVTEHEQRTVPVRHERVRVEREPAAGETVGPQDIGEAEREVTLHEERPVVQTETVPVEKVRLTTETEVEQQQVGADVRRERIEADVPEPTDRERGRGSGR